MSATRTSAVGLLLASAALPLLTSCGQAGTSTAASTSTVTVTVGAPPTSGTPQVMPATATSVPAQASSAPKATGNQVVTTHSATTRPSPKQARPVITSYSASETTIACSAGGPGVPAKLDWDITLTWSAKHATAVYLGIDTADAVHNSYSGAMPVSGSVTVGYGCYDPHTYTLAAVGTDGKVVHQTITVRNVGDPGS